MKDTLQDLNTVKMLLDPLGLECSWNSFECVVLKDNEAAAAITLNNGICGYQAYSATFSNPGILLNFLMRRIISFLFADACVKNPYFGCNSLEEAAVKADLIEMHVKNR